MNKIDVGQALQIVANLGVIAGIVFLAIEVRQNQAVLEEGNQMNLVAVSAAANDNFSSFRKLILENEDLFRIWESGVADDELSDFDEARFDQLCSELIFTMASTYRYYALLEEEATAINSARVLQVYMQSERFLTCWQDRKAPVRRMGLESESFISLVEGE